MTNQVAVLDTETTGIGEEDQVVEMATVLVPGSGRPDEDWESLLVRPTCPVSLEPRAVHHITDAELERALTMGHALADGMPLCRGAEVVAAHNLEFDLRLLLQSGVPRDALPARTICTWRCSLHLYPDPPSHSNQVLRYYLGLVVPPVEGPPHRALPDAVVTAELLRRMLRDRTLGE